MIKDNEPLRIFVAMPGSKQSIGGQSASWPDPEAIKKFFFEKIAQKLREDLKQRVILEIEKDKYLGGVIHDSMYAEAWQSHIYIADLTGNNANVYLELGVRWALKDNVTVVVSQDVASIKFNVSNVRITPYSQDPALLEQAIERVVKTIKDGLADKYHVDSPVRLKGDIAARSKDEVEAYENTIRELKDELETVKRAQGRGFLDIAGNTEDLEQRIVFYQKAIQINPALVEAYLPLAEELRKQNRYDEALIVLERAILLFSKNAEFFREQGVTYKKKRQFEQAAASLRKAVALNEKDDEAWSNLGGLLRDIGTGSVPFNWDILREARDCYQKALELNDRNAYAQGNIARLDLLLSKIEPERKSLILEELDTLEALCRLDLKKNPKDYWRWFDQADSYLLSGKVDEGYLLYTKTIELVPVKRRASELSSVISPLISFLVADVLDDRIKGIVQKIIEDLNSARTIDE